MRNINFIRLQNFIYFYAPNDKKKRYTLNKLHEVETEFEAQKKQISIYKKILEDVFEKYRELCSLCEKKGQCLPECECMDTEECMNKLFMLYERKAK